MSIAVGSRALVQYIEETTFGTTPSTPNMTVMRIAGATPSLTRKTLQPAEIRYDRQIQDFRLGNKLVTGDLNLEFLYGDHDWLLQQALAGTWSSESSGTPNTLYAGQTAVLAEAYATGAGTAGPFTHTAAHTPIVHGSVSGVLADASTFTDDGNGGITGANVSAGSVNYFTGAMSITTTGHNQTGAITVSYRYYSLNRRSFSLEVGFLDIVQYRLFKGCFFDKLAFDMKNGSIATIKATIMGQDAADSTSSAAASQTFPSTNSPMDTFTGTVNEGGNPIAYLQSITMNLNLNEEAAEVVGSKLMYDHAGGRIDITGEVKAYFPDRTMLTKFLNETESELDITLAGVPTNKTINVKLPRIKYTTGDVGVPNEKLLIQTLKWQALRDSTTGAEMILTRSNP